MKRLQHALFLLAFMLLAGCGETQAPYTGPALPYTPEPVVPSTKVEIVTSEGTIELELWEDSAPNTVANFVQLVEKKFYDGLTFHRIVKNFMIQGGDPLGNGMGGPGYKFKDEIEKRTNNKVDHYVIAMANSGPNTNGSQFFIVTNPQGAHHLDSLHTVFGKVISGFPVVDKLNEAPVKGDRPINPPKIISMRVLSKRDHEYAVKDTVPDAGAIAPPPATPKTDNAKKDETKKEEPKKDDAKTEEPKK
jgi:cyclophilin family peptidyl-prolyl cis-trans isomerase